MSPKLKKKYNITDERQELLDAIADWMKRVSDKGGKFRCGRYTPLARHKHDRMDGWMAVTDAINAGVVRVPTWPT